MLSDRLGQVQQCHILKVFMFSLAVTAAVVWLEKKNTEFEMEDGMTGIFHQAFYQYQHL